MNLWRKERRRALSNRFSWVDWHDRYDNPDSWLARRIRAVQKEVGDAVERFPPGPIRVVSICAGDGRDLFGVLERHPRRGDAVGRLVELDATLVDRARANAPAGVEVVCADAGLAASYEGAVPADLLMCCGVLSHLSDADAQNLINAWRALAAPGATVIMNQGGPNRPLRPELWEWIAAPGFRCVASAGGAADLWRVGVYEWPGPSAPFNAGDRYFTFGSRPARSLFSRRIAHAYRTAKRFPRRRS